jgi:hypothetical protein
MDSAIPATALAGRKGLTAEESLLSTETGSQVTDPLLSWVADSQPFVEPPAKVARMGEREVVSEERELRTVEKVQSEESDEGLTGVRPDLRTAVTLVAPIPQAKRTPTVPYARKKKVMGVTANRKSARCKGAAGATPIMKKAQRRTEEKNLERHTDKNKTQGNDYTLLDSFSDSHLESVARDSCIIFNPRAGTKEEALSLIRVKELAQAMLAEAADARLLARRRMRHALGRRRRWEPTRRLGMPMVWFLTPWIEGRSRMMRAWWMSVFRWALCRGGVEEGLAPPAPVPGKPSSL